MSTLQDFLNSNPVDNLTDEVPISDRFKDKKGNLLKFKIKAMDDTAFEEIRKRSMQRVGKNRTELKLKEFNSAIAISHTLEPNFKDAESIKKLGCATPEEYLSKVLLPGEIVKLSDEIQQLSGFKSLDELVEEAKN